MAFLWSSRSLLTLSRVTRNPISDFKASASRRTPSCAIAPGLWIQLWRPQLCAAKIVFEGVAIIFENRCASHPSTDSRGRDVDSTERLPVDPGRSGEH